MAGTIPAVAEQKPWWRTWTGYPEWARDLVGWDGNVIATDPEGQTWEIDARPTGVPRLQTLHDLPFWALGWPVHVFVYRLQWNLWIGLMRPRKLSKPRKWLYQRYRSKDEAKAAVPVLVERITAGTWRPSDELPGD